MSACTALWFGICCSREGDVSVGGVSVVTGVEHGIPLKGHQMMLALTSQRELVLFSGDRQVGVPHRPCPGNNFCVLVLQLVMAFCHFVGSVLVDQISLSIEAFSVVA